ncbi:hypothetical protein COLO4_38527 [Corchorus olitorius]|uniref:Pentatricopeptide repeat-containing protein n=1 Tax=Corchorus olitorius TaxID=93759 RepID=A0A1R3FUF1_9ROSI|nr:hypothetical protein COLO4_38527 [Corchorus olitorius]
MIAGHVQNGQVESALNLFHELLASGIRPDEFIISNMLSACADLVTARLGDIDSVALTFRDTMNPDLVPWSVMINCYAQHGYGRDALELFELMKEHGIAPNHITFTGVLYACSHAGLVEEELRMAQRKGAHQASCQTPIGSGISQLSNLQRRELTFDRLETLFGENDSGSERRVSRRKDSASFGCHRSSGSWWPRRHKEEAAAAW